MFKQIEILSVQNHKDLKYKPAPGYGFARNLHAAPLAAVEVGDAAKHFPIVFPVRDEKEGVRLPMAILSLKNGQNAYVDDKGGWLGGYIPAHIRRYPFVLGTLEDSDQFAVMIDRQAPQFQTDEGIQLFSENGDPSDVVNKAKDFLGKYQADVELTLKLTAMLEEKDVLVEKQYDVSRGDEKFSLKGFRVVDTQKLAALDDATLAAWVRNGAMGIIIGHLHSLNNVQALGRLQQIKEASRNSTIH